MFKQSTGQPPHHYITWRAYRLRCVRKEMGAPPAEVIRR
jgi:hypothetical protein